MDFVVLYQENNMSTTNTQKNMCKLASMFTLNFGFFLVELIVGYLCKSMSLVADSFHMLSDVAALVVAFIAIKMSSKKWSKNTFGWARAEVLGALVNSIFLIALCFSIVVESIKRFITPEPVEDPLLVLIVGVIGLLMNLVGLCIFSDPHTHGHNHSHGPDRTDSRHSQLKHSNRLTRMVSSAEDASESDNWLADESFETEKYQPAPVPPVVNKDIKASTNASPPQSKSKGADQMNIRGVFLHLLADALGSVIVVVSALIIWLTDWKYNLYIDPCLSVFMVALILISVYPLLQESSLILLQSVPTHIKVDDLEKKLVREIDGVMGVHELHIWQLAGDRIVATAHIKCRTLEDYFQVAGKVKQFFHHEGIHSTTIQPEFSQQQSPDVNRQGNECYLSCSTFSATNCEENTCCGPLDSSRTSSLNTTSVP